MKETVEKIVRIEETWAYWIHVRVPADLSEDEQDSYAEQAVIKWTECDDHKDGDFRDGNEPAPDIVEVTLDVAGEVVIEKAEALPPQEED